MRTHTLLNQLAALQLASHPIHKTQTPATDIVPRVTQPGSLYADPAKPKPIMSPGARECICGRTISANVRYCLKCSEQNEYMTLVLIKANGSELPMLAETKLKELHVRFTADCDWREQTISFAYGNIKLHNPAVTREMVREQLDTLRGKVVEQSV